MTVRRADTPAATGSRAGGVGVLRTGTDSTDDVLMSVRDVTKYFPIREGVMQRVTGHVRAVDGVGFDLTRGTTLGLVGESGCGKTTLGRLVAGLEAPTSGGVFVDFDAHSSDSSQTVPIHQLKGDPARRFRRNCQMVFQDSFSSLNPRHLVRDIVGRPLKVHKEASGGELTERVVELLEQVGLGRQHLYRYPHQFSGGQRQRISIARALALDPEMIVLDEPTSALDVSVQAQILNLLHWLQAERGLTYLFITHDLSVVRHMAEKVVVMYLGRVAEAGPTEPLFAEPQHPYTRALLRSSPELIGDTDQTFLPGLEGNVPDPARPPSGCRFHTRCDVSTVRCGWEIDDVIGRLEDVPQMFDQLSGVTRRSAFDADLTFDDAASAERLAEALTDPGAATVPGAMIEAVESLSTRETTVSIRFREVPEVVLEDRGERRQVACLLDELPD
ncbi:MAG: ATP-binding cassette domain-containing protein [Acidimicrobiia bacterium]|nr:ATP-binding cassette domain-containing protein [Acidimicrobiia bacterium]